MFDKWICAAKFNQGWNTNGQKECFRCPLDCHSFDGFAPILEHQAIHLQRLPVTKVCMSSSRTSWIVPWASILIHRERRTAQSSSKFPLGLCTNICTAFKWIKEFLALFSQFQMSLLLPPSWLMMFPCMWKFLWWGVHVVQLWLVLVWC